MTLRVWLAAAVLLTLAAECGLARAAEREKTIFTKVTPYATIVVKKGEGGLLTLWFGGNKYPDSAVKVGDPDYIEFEYPQAMTVALALAGEPKRVLIVGLGGGTLPSLFRKHYPGMVIDTVDIDPDVVDVAKKLFGFREDPAMRVYVEDGRQFIEKCKDSLRRHFPGRLWRRGSTLSYGHQGVFGGGAPGCRAQWRRGGQHLAGRGQSSAR